MGTRGLEAIFISNVVDSVSYTIIGNVCERSTDGDGFVVCASVLEDTGFFSLDSIAGLITVKNIIKVTISWRF